MVPTAQTLFGASATTPLNAAEMGEAKGTLGTLCHVAPLKWATKVLAWALESPEEPTAQTSSVASEDAATGVPPRGTMVGVQVVDIGDPNQSYNFWGWLLGYNAATLAQSLVFNVAPNGTFGGIWMSGDAPALDSSGSLFLSTGNGTFDDTVSQPLPPLPPNSDFAMSFLKLNPSTLAVEDFYTPSMEATWSNNDQDISSGGVTVIPDGMGPSGHPNLLVGSDKQGHLWLIDRSAMSEFNASADNTVEYLSLPLQYGCSGPCVSSTPGYYNGTVYTGMSNNPLMAFPLTNGLIPDTTGPYSGALTVAAAASESAENYGYPSPTPAISASPTGNAIVWVLDDSANHTDSGAAPGKTAP